MNHAAHSKCEHVLAFCEKCEVPYCSKCNFEWAQPCRLNHSNWITYPYTPNVYPGTTLLSKLSTSTGTLMATNHASHVG